jgi:hypothetical protein
VEVAAAPFHGPLQKELIKPIHRLEKWIQWNWDRYALMGSLACERVSMEVLWSFRSLRRHSILPTALVVPTLHAPSKHHNSFK